MESFSAAKSVESIKSKFTLIYILNCTDIIFTYSLLKTGDFFEANYMMRSIVTNPHLSVLVKIVCPALIISLLLPRIKEEKKTSLTLCHVLINIVTATYLVINMMHIYYLTRILTFH